MSIINQLKIGVIGANGFVGNYLCKQLKLIDYSLIQISIRGLAISIDGRKINELNQLRHIFSTIDIIIDCSSPSTNPALINQCIEESYKFIKIIDDSQFKGNYILLSSVSVYGQDQNVIDSSTSTSPFNPYGESKLLKENWLLNRYLNSSNYLHILRPSGILGLAMGNTFIRRITDKAISSSPISIYSDNDKFNCIISVENLVSIIKILITTTENQLITLGSSNPLTLYGIAELILKYTNSNSEILLNKEGRKPFTLDDDCWSGFSKYIQTTEVCLVSFLEKYVKYIHNKDFN
tara:strand:+ start:2109 stop:2987 length:879 start_codon:yes stop_codon:yes gene_type:complete